MTAQVPSHLRQVPDLLRDYYDYFQIYIDYNRSISELYHWIKLGSKDLLWLLIAGLRTFANNFWLILITKRESRRLFEFSSKSPIISEQKVTEIFPSLSICMLWALLFVGVSRCYAHSPFLRFTHGRFTKILLQSLPGTRSKIFSWKKISKKIKAMKKQRIEMLWNTLYKHTFNKAWFTLKHIKA